MIPRRERSLKPRFSLFLKIAFFVPVHVAPVRIRLDKETSSYGSRSGIVWLVGNARQKKPRKFVVARQVDSFLSQIRTQGRRRLDPLDLACYRYIRNYDVHDDDIVLTINLHSLLLT